MAGSPVEAPSPDSPGLTQQERRSLTHGEFWIPEKERTVYQVALRALNGAGIPYVVSGLYAIYEYTGIYRKTKDLDLFFEPRHVIAAARVLRDAGFETRIEQEHWLAKAFMSGCLIDLIYGMGNGLGFIDEGWYRHSHPGILAAIPVRIAPPEELLWHRLFVSERHRSDMADVVHLVLARGDQLDWKRILERTGDHWRLLLAQLHLFDFVYPGRRGHVPGWVRQELLERARAELDTAGGDPLVCQGTLISRFSFAIDVNEWGFEDVRSRAVTRACSEPIIQQIRESDVWTESGTGAGAGRGADDPDRE